MAPRTSVIALAVATLLSHVSQASYIELPPCTDPFTPFTNVGCVSKTGSTFDFRSAADQSSMTVAKCTAICKGNAYRYAALSYYGVCYCGNVNTGSKVDDAQCSYKCSGNQEESCGGPDSYSIWQDPTFPKTADQVAVSDYQPQGCYTDQSPRSLGHPQNIQDGVTPEKCISACKVQGYAYAGTEFGSECWCDSYLASQARKVADSECQKPCSGDASQTCGDANRINVYLAKDLESTEPCTSKVSSSSTSATPTPTPTTSGTTSGTVTTTASTTSTNTETSSTSGATTSTNTGTSSTGSETSSTGTSTTSTGISTTSTTLTTTESSTGSETTSTGTATTSTSTEATSTGPSTSSTGTATTGTTTQTTSTATSTAPTSSSTKSTATSTTSTSTKPTGTGTTSTKSTATGTSSTKTTSTTKTFTTSTRTTSTTSCVPTPTQVCVEGTGWLGHEPVCGVGLPPVSCNNDKGSFPHNPFKLFHLPDLDKCPIFPKASLACIEACSVQLKRCLAATCSWKRDEFSTLEDDEEMHGKRTFGLLKDLKCKKQWGLCVAANKLINPNVCKGYCPK